MKRLATSLLLLFVFITAAIVSSDPKKPKQVPDKKEKTPDKYMSAGISTADLPRIRRRGKIRALVSYNQTNYFQAKSGREYGFEYELLKQYEKYLNRGISRRRVPIHMVFVPVPFKELLPALLEGRGDIAAAGLTITKGRAARVAFSRPYLPNVAEIIISHKGAKPLSAIQDLSGQEIYVLRSSSYAEHLRRLNKRMRSQGLSPIKIIEADPFLQTEDILEMVNAGILDYTVADDHLARIWARILPELVLHSKLKVKEGSNIAWAVRPKNRVLLRSINGFLKKKKKGTVFGNLVFNRYFKNVKWIKNPVKKRERKKLEKIISLLKKYGGLYGFDWLLIAAQAYQESQLNQRLVSRAGAVGIMQILPKTAASRHVGIPNIRNVENNIHAGVKYMDYLRRTYFSGPEVSPIERLHFSHAAYNAGPRNVKRMRRLAKRMGLNPNVWFGNVERAALRVVGRETVRYVANIRKYYIAYKLADEDLKKRTSAKEKVRAKLADK